MTPLLSIAAGPSVSPGITGIIRRLQRIPPELSCLSARSLSSGRGARGSSTRCKRRLSVINEKLTVSLERSLIAESRSMSRVMRLDLVVTERFSPPSRAKTSSIERVTSNVRSAG